MSDADTSCQESPEVPQTESFEDVEKRLLAKIDEQAEVAARREADLRNEIVDLRRRVREAEQHANPPGEPVRFGPFGIFHEDPQDGTYRLALPLLIAISGAIFGMLLTLV
jgi:hypothetical protein